MVLTDLEKLNNLPYFSIDLLRSIYPDEGSRNLETNLYRWTSRGSVVNLKRGLYVTRPAFERFKDDCEYCPFIGCLMKYPSYYTAESVLQTYDMLSEGTYNYTFATTKTRGTITNALGSFFYRNIKQELFIGYRIIPFLEGSYYIANKAKALFDYVYFRTNIIPTDPEIDLVDELRLNLESMTKSDYRALRSYSKTTKRIRTRKIINNIIKNAPNYS